MKNAKVGAELLDQLNVALQPVEIVHLEADAASQVVDEPSVRTVPCPPVIQPSAIAPPSLQAQHNDSYSSVGGIMIGDVGGREFCVPVRNARGKDKSAAGVKRKRKCPNCSLMVSSTCMNVEAREVVRLAVTTLT